MGRIIETREYEEPKWEEFLWVIDGARLSGFMTVVENGDRVQRVRVAVGIPSDAQVISFGSVSRHPLDWNIATGEKRRDPSLEEMVEISWYSAGLRMGRSMLIPRELTQVREEGGPLRIQVVDVSLYSYGPDNQPTVNNIP